MKIKTIISAIIMSLFGASGFGAGSGAVKFNNEKAVRVGDQFRLITDLVLDSLKLGSNRQLYFTPVVEDASGNTVILPSVLVNGHSMHIAYERKTLPLPKATREILIETKRNNGKPQTINYLSSVPLEKWMMTSSAAVRWVVDSCGCGHEYGNTAGVARRLNLNPAAEMRVAYITPAVTELPVSIHEGKAQVKFEVSKSELHAEPYICKNGQKIDNRRELKIIDDSISYALSDPNVEIAKIRIVGYASPEGTYLGNERLSTDRSRALAEYLGARYQLPSERTEYGAVAENWEGFRRQVVEAKELTEGQKKSLLALIDRPAYGPADYDAKEKELRTNPAYSSLFKTKILPEWFPQLRETKFEVSTRLKPMSDEKLAEVIVKTPEKMSLNQMFRVARLYPEGSKEFNDVIETALKYYPHDETANLNAAASAIRAGEYERAAHLLERSGESAEAQNARGILATEQGDMELAREYFKKAGALPEAAKNKGLIE